MITCSTPNSSLPDVSASSARQRPEEDPGREAVIRDPGGLDRQVAAGTPVAAGGVDAPSVGPKDEPATRQTTKQTSPEEYPPADPDAPGRGLDETDEPIPEPNEPA